MKNIIIMRHPKNNYLPCDVVRMCHIGQAIKNYNFEYYQWVKVDKNGLPAMIKDYNTFYADEFCTFIKPNFTCTFIEENEKQIKMVVQYKKLVDFSCLLDNKNFRISIKKTSIPNTKIYLIDYDSTQTNGLKTICQIKNELCDAFA